MKNVFALSAFAVSMFAATAAQAAQFSGEFYGDLRGSVMYMDELGSNTSPNTQDDIDMVDNGTKVGVKASVSEGDLTGFIVYERGLDTESTPGVINDPADGLDVVRQAYIGVTSKKYGTATFGQTHTGYKAAAIGLDPFYDTSLSGIAGQNFVFGAGYGLSLLNNFCAKNGLTYDSPEIAPGFKFNAGVYLNDEGATDLTGTVATTPPASVENNQGSREKLGLAVGAQYKIAGVTTNVQYLDSPAGASIPGVPGPKSKAMRATASYVLNGIKLGASYENIDVKDGSSPRDYYFASATVPVTAKGRAAVTMGSVNDTTFEGLSATVGYFYDVLPNTTVYGGYRYYDQDKDAGDADRHVLAVGVSHKFSFGWSK